MSLSRRSLFGTLAATALLPMPALAARAHYPLHCDPELAPALNAAAAAFLAQTDIRIHVLPTSQGLLVPQIAHVVQSDIVMTRLATLAGLEAIGHGVPDAPHPKFDGRLVLAALNAEAKGGTIAAVDRLPGESFDSATVLQSLGLDPGGMVGAVDTADVAYLVTSGAVQAGLVYLSDVRADPRLKVVAEAQEPVRYVAATTQMPRRPEPESFLTFLAAAPGQSIMRNNGLEYRA